MKYKVGDRVRIKSLEWYNENKGKADKTNSVWCEDGCAWFFYHMSQHCGKIMTIKNVWTYSYTLEGSDSRWTDEMIEGLVEEETKPKFKVGDKITNGKVSLTILTLSSDRYIVEDNFGGCGILYFNTLDDWKIVEDEILIEKVDDNGLPFNEWLSHKGAFHIPDGYELKDENGNIINATKIVLEKKKKEYPKTYEECYKVLGYGDIEAYCIFHTGADERLFEALYRLKVCRDAYWKLYGEEMGLGKPWEPDFDNLSTNLEYMKIDKGCFTYSSRVFVFPTEEMRDAFKENFDPDIEICKEFL